MEKGDPLAAGAIEGFVVNQPHTRAGGLTKLALDNVRAEGDVMDAAGGIFLEKLGNGTLRAGRLKEFEVNLAHGKKGGADFLRGDFFAVLTFQAERLFIVRHSLIQRLDGDAKVVNFCYHKFNSAGRFPIPTIASARRRQR